MTSFVGPAAVDDGSGATGGFAISYQRDRVVWSLRAQLGSDNQPCPSSDCGPGFGELGLLVGYGTRAGRTLHASAAAGIGLAAEDSTWGVGLPLEVQLNWRPTRFIGAGLYAWANSFGPSYGLGAAVHLGRLR